MKHDFFGYRDTLRIYEPGCIPEGAARLIEDFRFPKQEFSSEEERQREIAIENIYNERSASIVIVSNHNEKQILAFARIISKHSADELLPIEYGMTVSTEETSPDASQWMAVGQPFTICNKFKEMPVCEVGGLRAAEPSIANGISVRERYSALDLLLKMCKSEAYRRKYKAAFLTCSGTPSLVRLYREKLLCEEVGQVQYGNGGIWRALWKKLD